MSEQASASSLRKMTDPYREAQRSAATRQVWKHALPIEPGLEQTVELPYGAKIVHVHEQYDHAGIWFEVNTSAPAERRTFAVYATGQPVDVRSRYVGTVHVSWTVWHVYEIANQ